MIPYDSMLRSGFSQLPHPTWQPCCVTILWPRSAGPGCSRPLTVSSSWSSLWCERGGPLQVLFPPSLERFRTYPFSLTPWTKVETEDTCGYTHQLAFPLLIMKLFGSYFASLKPSRLLKNLQLGYVLIKYVYPVAACGSPTIINM